MRKRYYDDAKENAAFERCVDVVTVLILKYGPAIKRKWILRDWIKNIQADCFWRSLACKRYQRYFDCMKAIVKMTQHDIIGSVSYTHLRAHET